jgi:hypothetical protein
MSSFGSDTLFGDLGKHEIFTPFKTYPPMTVKEIGKKSWIGTNLRSACVATAPGKMNSD